jgi:outer membrane protein
MNTLLRTFLIIATCCFSSGILYASGPQGSDPPAESRTLSLQEAVQLSLNNSPEVLIAEAQAIRAVESLRESRSLNRPQVIAGTGLAYNNGFPLSIEGSAPSIFKAVASQSILSSKNANLIREAKESAKAGKLGTDLARNEVAAKTALVYYRLNQARRIQALASQRVETTRKQQELIEISLEAGKVRPIEAIMAKTAVDSAQQQLLIAQEATNIAEAELQALTGLASATFIRTTEPNFDSPLYESQMDVIYQQALGATPEIMQAEAQVKAKEFHIEAEKGERWPKIEGIGEYALFSPSNNYEDYFRAFERNNYLVGLSIQVPLLDGSRASARIAQSKQEASAEKYRLQQLKSDLKVNIQRGLSALRIARGASALAHNDLAATKEMVQVNNALLESGKIGSKELEDSRLQVQQKELTLIEADQILFQRKLELLRITGSVASTLLQ